MSEHVSADKYPGFKQAGVQNHSKYSVRRNIGLAFELSPSSGEWAHRMVQYKYGYKEQPYQNNVWQQFLTCISHLRSHILYRIHKALPDLVEDHSDSSRPDLMPLKSQLNFCLNSIFAFSKSVLLLLEGKERPTILALISLLLECLNKTFSKLAFN